MKLYGVALSPFVRKVLFTFGELGLVGETIDVAPHSTDADFRRTSPAGRIPGFADGDFLINDSAAICRYLVVRERSELMGGPSPQRQGRIVQWETWGDAALAPALMTPLLERVVKPVRLKQTTDEDAVDKAVRDALPPAYEALDKALAERGPWLIGEVFSHADIAIGAHMASAELANVLPDEARFKHLTAWLSRVQERPAYQTTMEQTRATIKRLENG
ncbi:glutathione S-transferase family protein [uncultured Salinisphaera sp.]|uniref:glutathione S-transferase family protein n=1 Tax=uncultured Salinisphaera sp. TaxID=359372 RepID=UPI0032B10DBF|tara:strand:- start:46 stop:699 length:654 start_codon:yes stop_codon:yes gene_type:complete